MSNRRDRARRAERRRVVSILNATRPRVSIAPKARLVVVRRSLVARRSSNLRLVEDRRTFHPARATRPAAGFFYSRHRLQVPVKRPGTRLSVSVDAPLLDQGTGPVPVGVQFRAPRQVAICVRRKIRRQVILANGRGGGHHRRPRRNEFSGVQC